MMKLQTEMIQSQGVEAVHKDNWFLPIKTTPIMVVVEPSTVLPTTSVESINAILKKYEKPKKRKYDTNEAIDKIYNNYRMKKAVGETPDLAKIYEEVIVAFYDQYAPQVRSITKRYRLLSTIYEEEDLKQAAMEAIMTALRYYDYRRDIDMKFSTFLDWKIRNTFQRALGTKDKYVEIYKDNHLVETIDYHHFVTRKKSLKASGHTYITKSRSCQLS